LVGPTGVARATVPLQLPSRPDAKTLLRLWAYGSETLRTRVVLVGADGSRRVLGNAGNWAGETFDVTRQAGPGTARLRVTRVNRQTAEASFLDRVAPGVAPHGAVAAAASGQVALLVLLAAAALRALCGRLGGHW